MILKKGIQMEKKNDGPKIIIQLILGVVIYYVFTFKYKTTIISTISEQAYYQALVIIVIINSYVAKWLDDLRLLSCHGIMLLCSKKYKRNNLLKKKDAILEKAKTAKLTETSQKKLDEISAVNLELDDDIDELFSAVQKLNSTQSGK